uniref:Uncharacterized protein n=1 Tax=Zea mays TaxID=4577 RepID=A0A804Q2P1_MAIZE
MYGCHMGMGCSYIYRSRPCRRGCHGDALGPVTVLAPMPEHALPEAELLKARLEPGVRDVEAPVAILRVGLLGLPPVPLQPGLLPRPQQAVGLELPGHPVVHLPPPGMRDVAGELAHPGVVPVAVVVSEAQPRLEAKVVEDVEDRRVRTEQLGLLRLHGLAVALPEVLEEVHVPGDAVPPREYLVEVPLVPAVVRGDLVDVVHEQAERAVGGLDDHDAGVEERGVVARRGDLRHGEQEVDV